MRGLDIARYQGNVDFTKVRKAGYEFVIAKCTESVGYRDPMYQKNKDGARKAGLLFGSYHFGRATNARKEAEYFVSQVGDILPGELLVLDYELYTLKDPASWCLDFLKRVEELVGFRPILYTYHGILNAYNWKKVSDANFGLWAARYGLQEQNPNQNYKPSTGSWPFYVIWQYCSRGKIDGITGYVDLNHCDISLDTLKKYGKQEVICNHQCPKHC